MNQFTFTLIFRCLCSAKTHYCPRQNNQLLCYDTARDMLDLMSLKAYPVQVPPTPFDELKRLRALTTELPRFFSRLLFTHFRDADVVARVRKFRMSLVS